MRSSALRWPTLVVALAVVACDGAVGPDPLGIAIFSGDEQIAKAGEYLPEPLVVQLTDSDGHPAPMGIQVEWTVVTGRGGFFAIVPGDGGWDDWGTPGLVLSVTTQTVRDGLAHASFMPTDIGSSLVRVARGGDEVFFTIVAKVRVVSMGVGASDPDCPSFFVAAPRCTNVVTVPVGTSVEWVNHSSSEHGVVSSSTPAGGRSFDSGMLGSGDRFRFTPSVPGTWHFGDPVSGSAGTLVATDG